MDLSDFLPAYLVEVEELLAAANTHLLALETGQRQGHASPRAVRELFRALHTIKGLSAMIDVGPIVTIAHSMETALRHADQAGGRLPETSIEPLMEGLRGIEQRVRQLADSKTPAPVPVALQERLEALETASVSAPRGSRAPVALTVASPLAGKLSEMEREQLVTGVTAGRRAVQLDFHPNAERAAQGRTINTVREAVGKLAEIIKVVPVAGPAPGGGNLTFVLFLLTEAQDAVLLEVAGGPPSVVRSLTALPPAAPPPLAPAPLEEEAREEEVAEPRRGGVLRVEVTRLDEALERLAALVVNRSRLVRAVQALTAAGAPTRELHQILQENARLLRDMRATILGLRMVRVGDVLERLPLLVRGLRRTTGKNVRLALDVGDAELDKSVADRLLPALVHLVRNAVDHAIELPAQRRAAGKPEEGLVRVACHAGSNGRLEISISDDGGGVDAQRVAARAGAPVPDSADALLELLCRPGLSTREAVTETSGRGMGMDIVKRIIVDQLGGELRLDTRPGVGSTFAMRVPLTITIVDAFIFECSALRYAVAVSTVEEIIEVDPARVVRTPGLSGAGVSLVERRGTAVPVVSLQKLLGGGAGQDGSGSKAFVVRQRGEPVAFAVDRLLGQQEIVLRPLEDPLVRVAGVAGATDLGDGLPTLVLDLAALGSAGGGPRRGGAGQRERAS